GPVSGGRPDDAVAAIRDDLLEIRQARGWEERMTDEWIEGMAPLIAEESARYDLPPALVMGIIQLESEYDPAARAWSGASGLMQVMPLWLKELEGRFGTDLLDEATNLRYGTWVLQDAL